MNWLKTLHHIGVAVFIVSIVVICIFLTQHPAESAATQDMTTELKVEDLSILDRFTTSEKVRIQEIIGRAVSDSEYLTPEIRKEFWAIIGKHGPPPADVAKTVREFIVDTTVKSQRYFWEDALLALKIHRPHKSVQREQLEKKLVKGNLLPEWRVKKNDELIEQIAAQRPIQVREEEIIFDEKGITETLENIEKVAQRIEVLFTPPYNVPASAGNLPKR